MITIPLNKFISDGGNIEINTNIHDLSGSFIGIFIAWSENKSRALIEDVELNTHWILTEYLTIISPEEKYKLN